jgi:hypothetical protein
MLDFHLLVREIKSEFCGESFFYNADSPLPEALTGVRDVGPDCPDASVWLPFAVELVGETSLQKPQRGRHRVGPEVVHLTAEMVTTQKGEQTVRGHSHTFNYQDE